MEQGWWEIHRLQYSETGKEIFNVSACWNEEKHICLIETTSLRYSHTDRLLREAKWFSNWVDALEWAQKRAPQLFIERLSSVQPTAVDPNEEK